MSLLELPDDIISIVLSFLPPKEYLKFCRSSKQVYIKYRQDSVYWRNETSTTFRLPISPLLAADGPRWYWLYKRLKTQTRLYTWGQGVKGNLGPGRAVSVPRQTPVDVPPRVLPRIPTRPQPGMLPPRPIPARPYPLRAHQRRQIFERVSSNWPTEVDIPDHVGVLSDLQCGGWSTTILSSDGKLYTTGAIDSSNGRLIGEASDHFRHLEYLTQSTSAIRQFSSGRSHILGLTDHGQIISWDRINNRGLMVFSRSGASFEGKPTRVAAGWGESSAYVPNVGIIYWTPIQNDQTDEILDGKPVKEKVIPGTAVQTTGHGYVEVLKHIVLEDFIVYITNESKIYACSMRTDSPDQSEPSQTPFEIPGYGEADRELKDVQGQFRRFSVFTAAGEVLSGDVDYVRRCAEAIRDNAEAFSSSDWSTLTTLLASRPLDIPALQRTGVIAVAYGDHHFHALQTSGRITSYGVDPQFCGSLGLSGPGNGLAFRGLRQDIPGPRRDGELLPIANLRGRQVWFEPEKKDWLQWMADSLGQLPRLADGQLANHVWRDAVKAASFSEWVEQEGSSWEEGPVPGMSKQPSDQTFSEDSAEDYANLGSYFPVAIAAAGWHSGALVLVDETKTHAARKKWVAEREIDNDEDKMRSMPGSFETLEPDEEYIWKRGGFPKVLLPNGFEMPGEGDPRPWREGMPTMQELGLA